MKKFTDEQFMTAEKKEKVLADWLKFLSGGLRREDFTKRLYTHLHLHCSFIAHYDINGFYETYFVRGDDTVRFLEQFDGERLRINHWASMKLSGAYSDVTRSMVEEAEKYLPVLYAKARSDQKKIDLTTATALLEKHGLTLNDAVKPQTKINRAAAAQGSLF